MSLSFTCWPWSKKLGLGLATSFCAIVCPSVVLTWPEISFTNGNCIYKIVDLSGNCLICFHIVPLSCFILDCNLPRLKGTENQGIGSTTASRMVNLLCLGKKTPSTPPNGRILPLEKMPERVQKWKWWLFFKHHGWSGRLLGVGGLPHLCYDPLIADLALSCTATLKICNFI